MDQETQSKETIVTDLKGGEEGLPMYPEDRELGPYAVTAGQSCSRAVASGRGTIAFSPPALELKASQHGTCKGTKLRFQRERNGCKNRMGARTED